MPSSKQHVDVTYYYFKSWQAFATILILMLILCTGKLVVEYEGNMVGFFYDLLMLFKRNKNNFPLSVLHNSATMLPNATIYSFSTYASSISTLWIASTQ